MPPRSYGSLEEWRRQEQDKRLRAATKQAAGTVGVPLRVRAELAVNAAPSALHECRTVVLEWLQGTFGGRLPRKAWRHRPFSLRADAAAIRAARLRDGFRDHWAVQVERTPGSDREVTTGIVVARAEAGPPSVGVTVRDRSVVPVETVHDYPGEMLAAMAERVPLLQGGRRLTARPVVVESDTTMNAFLKMLVDQRREMPFAVVSVPPEREDRSTPEAQWDSLARALTGLATTWVLPSAMTYRLSDTVSKPLSVFLGAWRFYRPGFHPGADRSAHPLVLRNRMTDERAVRGIVQQFLRMAAEERMRFDPAGQDLPEYEAIAGKAASASGGRARLVSFLRNSLLRRAGSARRFGYPVSSADPDAGLKPDPGQGPAGGSIPSPTLVREPPPADLAAQLAGPGGRPEAGPQETPLLRRKLRAARETARVRATRYERARERAERAELERDHALKRAEQLAGLVRSMGGNPDAAVPFPTTWDEFAAWCDENLAGRLALAGSARREVGGAEFRDVALAARCLGWLAADYRDGRLRGGNPGLHGRIDDIEDGVYNVPCGGDSFDCTWDGRTHAVDWHIKRGANTRDPRRCLRIYYFWDDRSRQVVVASMPAHRRSALS